MMASLNGYGRSIITANIDLIPIAVWQVRTPLLDEDERTSAAQLAFCEAVMEYTAVGGDLRSFCLKRMRWQIIKDIRSKRRRPAGQLTSDPVDFNDFTTEIDRKDLGDRMIKKLTRLTERQKEVINLFLEGLSPGEIASRLGTSPSGFTNLFKRTVARLLSD